MNKEQIQDLIKNRNYPGGGEAKLVETHAHWVVLTPSHVFKIKKPLEFSFLDYSSLEKRKYYCEEELRLNRRFVSGVYLDVLPIIQTSFGITIGPNNQDPIDYCVHMRRLDSDHHMPKLLAKNLVQQEHMEGIAHRLASVHQQHRLYGTGPDWKQLLEDFIDIEKVQPFLSLELGKTVGRDILKINAQTQFFLRAHHDRITERIEQGFTVDGHGDLHTGNIFLEGDQPILFDCIEFNVNFRKIDILSELAFLCMDLEYHHRDDLSDYFIEAYSQEFDPMPEGNADLFLFLFFKSYRANVRLKVGALQAMQQGLSSEDRTSLLRYYELMKRYHSGMHHYNLR
jgi:aminoglycoside phosphotransferase family enzyme